MTTTRHRPSPPAAAAAPILRPTASPARVLATAAVVIAAIVAVGIWLKAHPIDLGTLESLNRLHTNLVGAIASTVYTCLEPVPAILLTVCVTGMIWAARKSLRLAAAFAGVVAATWVPSDLVKLAVGRVRPDASVLTHPFSPAQTDPSYPSGHTVFVVAFVIALTWVLRDTRWWAAVVGVGAAFSAVVAASLMIDAVHFPLDVVASICWALAVAPAARYVWVDLIMPRVPVLAPARTSEHA